MYPFKDGQFAPKNAWYVAAFICDVGKDLVSRTIVNEPMVLYRKQNGEAVAVGGRCPHRHYPLGASCRRNDDIVCGYHGISFGPDGKCTGVPSQDNVPPSYRIPTFPVAEHGLWVWVWPGDPEKADTAMLPPLQDIWLGVEGMHSRPMYFHEIKCRYQLMNDNLLDLSHLGYLHGTTIGTDANAKTPETIEKRPGFISSRRNMKNIVPAAMMMELGLTADDRVDRISGMDFYAPGFHAGVDETLFAADHPSRAGEYVQIVRVYHAVTPSTPDRTYYWFGMSGQREDQLDFAEEYLKSVVAEDVFASEEIEKMLQLLGEYPKELMIKTDAGAVEGRRMIGAMMDAEAVA